MKPPSQSLIPKPSLSDYHSILRYDLLKFQCACCCFECVLFFWDDLLSTVARAAIVWPPSWKCAVRVDNGNGSGLRLKMVNCGILRIP
jgi:hypothetical protein